MDDWKLAQFQMWRVSDRRGISRARIFRGQTPGLRPQQDRRESQTAGFAGGILPFASTDPRFLSPANICRRDIHQSAHNRGLTTLLYFRYVLVSASGSINIFLLRKELKLTGAKTSLLCNKNVPLVAIPLERLLSQRFAQSGRIFRIGVPHRIDGDVVVVILWIRRNFAAKSHFSAGP